MLEKARRSTHDSTSHHVTTRMTRRACHVIYVMQHVEFGLIRLTLLVNKNDV